MRIRTFTAATPQTALDHIRNEMGPDAVILAMDDAANGRGVIVRAAVDETVALIDPEDAFADTPLAGFEDRLEHLLKARLQTADWARHLR